MENSNESTNMNPMGSMNQMNNQAPVHTGHSKRNIVWVVVIIILAALAYFYMNGNFSKNMIENSTSEVSTQDDANAEVITNTNDDLSSIEADFNAMDFESLDAGLE